MKLLKLLLFFGFFVGSLGMNAQIEKTITPSGAIKFKGIIMHKGDAAPKALMLADVPKEQVVKDCQFFGGDTLNGFDFKAAEKGAQMQNAKMYKEYKSYIHQQQAAFVKQKYNIQTLPGELAGNRNGAPHTLVSACSNMDFENGDFSSWTITYGINQNSNGALTVAGTTPVYDINQNIYDCWPANQITAAYGNDPVSALPGLDPAGGTYSARLGGYFFNEAVGYDGGYCGNQLSNTYADGEIFSQSFVVTAANALISFDYQIVLNDGAHANGSQPYFHAIVTNAGGTVLSSCTDYSVQVNGGGGVPPGFINNGWVNGNDNSPIYNGPWISNSINLTPYIGQTIILKFSAAGCTLGGHWAYAYIDATCGPAALSVSNASPCAGSTSVLTAPAIYGGSYSWSGPGIVGSTTGQSITVNATGTYFCTITPIQGAGCAYTLSQSLTFTSPPTVSSISSGSQIVCSGSAVAAEGFTSSPAGGTFAWTNNNTNIGLAASGSGNIAGYTAPVVASQQIGTISVTPTVAGCVGTPSTFNITINPVPTVSSAPGAQAVCSGAAVAGEGFTSTPAGGTFAWTNSNTNIGIGASGAGNIAGYTAPIVASQQVGTISVTPTLAGCVGTPGTFNITINPLPTVSAAPGAQTICSGAAVAGEGFTSSPAGGTFNWTNNNTNIGIGASGSGNIAGYTAPVVASQQVGTISVTPTLAGCVGTPSTFNITINPKPTVSSAPGAQAVCSGAAVAGEGFTSTPAGGTFAWTNSNTNIGIGASGAGNIAGYTAPVVASQQVGTISVTPTLAGCVGTPGTFNITINPLPTVSPSAGSQTVCSGSAVSAENFTSSPVGATFAWTNNNTNIGIGASGNGNIAGYTAPVVATQQIGTISVTPTLSGCSAASPTTFNITINPKPTINVVPTSTAICSGAGSSTLTASGASTYTWIPAATLAPATGPVVTATPIVTTNYTVTGTDANNCVNTNMVSITVNATPTVSVVGGGGNSQTVCGGGLANATVTGITFTSTPSGAVNWTNSNAGIGIATSGSGNIASYAAPGVAAQTVGVITASSTSAAGCTSTSSSQLNYTVTIDPIPGETGGVITPAGCGMSNGTIIGASGTGGSTYSYSWNGGGFTASSAYTNASGTYQLQIKDNVTGCIYSQNFTIPNAGAPPAPTVTASATSVCVGGTVTLTAPTVVGVTYTWTEANGNSGSGDTYTVTNIPASPNPYTIGVTATSSGCTSAAATTSITVNPLPNPSISSSTSQICQGTSTTLSVTPTGNYSYQWGNSGGTIVGATANTLVVTASGSYSVTVTDNTTNCVASTSANGTITVNPLPTIDTTGVLVTQSSCTVATGSITNVTITGAATVTYTWTSGTANGPEVYNASGTNATLSNVSAGVYCLNVTDGNSCQASFCSITVTNAGAPAQPVLTAAGNDTTYCQGDIIQTLTVTVASSGTVTPTINWYSDAGLSTIIAANTNTYTPAGTPVGTTTVYVAATVNGCTSISRPITITINPTPPTPILTAPTGTNNSFCQGSPVPLTVNSGTSTAVWYSNNTVVNVGSTFTPPANTPAGSYTFSVIDSLTAGGCVSASQLANTVTLTLVVNSTPPAPILTAPTGTNNAFCQGSPVPLTVNSGTSAAVWYSNNTVVNVGSTFTPPANTPAGSYTFSVIDSLTAGGCVNASQLANTVTLTLVVNPTPPVPILTAPTGTNNAFCQGSPVPLTVNSGTSTAVWYSNNTVVNVGSTFTPPANTLAGTYTFSVIDSAAAGGCVSASQLANTVTLTLVVNPTPPAPILMAPTGTNNAFCQGSPVPLTVNSGGSTAVWYSNNTVVNVGSTFTPPANTPAGTYTFSVIDSLTAGGCVNASQLANTVTLTLVVNPIPPAPILTAPTGTNNAFCQGSPVPLTVNSGGSTAVWYSNNAVVYTGSSFTPPTSSYPAGSYTFSVIDSLTAGGCVNASQLANTVTLTLVVNPTPTINVSGASSDTARCGQATGGVSNLTVNNVSGGTPGYHFQWYSGAQPIAGATSPVLSGQQAGNYNLVVTDTNGCVANVNGGSLTFTVPASAAIHAQAITNPNPATGTIPLAVTFSNTSTGANSYNWSFGDGNSSTSVSPTNTYTNVGTYTVVLAAINGTCTDTFRINVIANIATTIIIPNIFSPNGDGINDEFFIPNTGMNSLNCDIFNRWGQLLHSITAPNQGWDGITPNGDKAPDGTYMYILQAQGLDGKTYKQQGTVTLVR